jgi:signal transduction histidine kinase
MSEHEKTDGKDLVASLRQEVDALKKQLEHHEHVEKMHHEAIADVSKAIYRLESFEKTAALIFQACKQATGAKSGYVAMLAPNRAENSVLYLDAGGMPCTVDPSLPMPIRGLRAEAYMHKAPASDNNFKDSPWMKFMPPGHVALKNVLFAPMIVGDEPKGLIGLANKPGGFTDEDAEIAMSYAGIAAIALQSSEMIEKIVRSRNEIEEAYQDASFLKDLLVHDINNALQAISSTVELWKLKIEKRMPATGLVGSLDLISDNVARGAGLIASIRKLEKLVDPKLSIEQIDIMRPLKESTDMVKKRFPSKAIEIHIDADDESAIANGTELIRDAYENILNNAVLHNDNPTVQIDISLRHVDDAGKPSVRLEVTDNGIGIDDSRKASIFDRAAYKQRGGGGMGIGLSVVKRIVTRFGGKIWVEDAVHGDYTRGSKFIIALPAASVSPATKPHPT